MLGIGALVGGAIKGATALGRIFGNKGKTQGGGIFNRALSMVQQRRKEKGKPLLMADRTGTAPVTPTGGSVGAVVNPSLGGDRSSGGDAKPSFWEENKKWLLPVAIGVPTLGIGAILLTRNKGQKKRKW